MTSLSGRLQGRHDRTNRLRQLVLFCAILLSGGNLIIPRLPLAIIALLIGIIAFDFVSNRINLRKSLIYIWLSMVFLIAIIWSLNGDIMAIVVRLMNFLVGLLLIKIYLEEKHRNYLIDDLRTLLLPLAYLAIVTFTLATVLPGAFIKVEFGAQNMYTVMGILNYSVPIVEGVNNIRPTGVFWEPGVFSAYLNILLFVLLIHNTPPLHVGATMLAIMLTQSTTGIAITALLCTYFILMKMLHRKITMRELVILLAILIAAPLIFSAAQENISAKFSGALLGSLSARTFDLETALQIVYEHPLLGIGFSDSAYLPYARSNPLAELALSIEDQDGRFNTNGVMTVLYSIGIPLGVIYLISIFNQKLFPQRILFGTLVFIILFSNPLAMNPFFVFLFFSGMIRTRKKHSSHSHSPVKQSTMPLSPTQA